MIFLYLILLWKIKKLNLIKIDKKIMHFKII